MHTKNSLKSPLYGCLVTYPDDFDNSLVRKYIMNNPLYMWELLIDKYPTILDYVRDQSTTYDVSLPSKLVYLTLYGMNTINVRNIREMLFDERLRHTKDEAIKFTKAMQGVSFRLKNELFSGAGRVV